MSLSTGISVYFRAVLVAWVLLLGFSSGAMALVQERGPDLTVVEAVASHVAKQFPQQRRVSFDPRSFTLGEWNSVVWGTARAETQIAQIIGPRAFPVKRMDQQAKTCSAATAERRSWCHFKDVDVVLAIGSPTIKGSTATVQISTWHNPQEKNPNRGIAWVATEIALEKRGNVWHVTGQRLLASER